MTINESLKVFNFSKCQDLKKQCLITPVKLKLGVRIKIWEPHVTPNPALLNL